MFGITLALIAGILLSFADAGKKALTKSFSVETVILLMFGFGLVINLLFLSTQNLAPINWSAVWLPALLCGLLAALGELLFLYGLKGADLSIAMPLFACLPIFSCLLGYLLFGEVPSKVGGGGACLIVVGAYLLLLKRPIRENFHQPLKRLFSDKACQFIVLSSAIGAVLFVGQRFGVMHSSPVTFFTMTIAVDFIIFLGVVICQRATLVRPALTPRLLSLLTSTGIAWSIGLTCLYASYNYTLSVYAGSVMQIQTLFSITLGALLFKEQEYLQRLLAGLLMVCGVVMISIGAAH
jgi:drug/metabolite transporter (DMT)-like permease